MRISVLILSALLFISCKAEENIDKIYSIDSEKTAIEVANNIKEFNRDKPNLQLIHKGKCSGLELKVYAPKKMPLVNIQLPERELPSDYDRGNVYFMLTGEPNGDVIIPSVLGTDWQIYSKNKIISEPQIGESHIQKDRVKAKFPQQFIKQYGSVGYFQLTELFTLYARTNSFTKGDYQLQVRTPDIIFSDGQKCGLGVALFSLELI